MIDDLLQALGQLRDGRTLGLLAFSAGSGLLLLIMLLVAANLALGSLLASGFGWLDWLIQAFGAAASLVAAWFAYPIVVTSILGIFGERICDAVERHHYPRLAAPRSLPLAAAIADAVRFLVLALALNLLVLPLYLLPGPNILIYLGLNGWLLGREYFDLVGLRRQARPQHRATRRSLRFEIWLAGAVIAAILLIPLVNLLAPVIGIGFMTHRYHRLTTAHRTPSL